MVYLSKKLDLNYILTELCEYVNTVEMENNIRGKLIQKLSEMENNLYYGGNEFIHLANLISSFKQI